MKRLVLMSMATIYGLIVGIPLRAEAVTGPELLISEVSAGSSNNSREEFIELQNISDRLIDFAEEEWLVQIASSNATNWQAPIRTIKLTGYLYPGVQYLIGTTFNQTENNESINYRHPEAADAYYAPALTASAGHIRIIQNIDQTQVINDEVEWVAKADASINHRSAFIATKPLAAGTSLTRRLIKSALQDTDNDAVDFENQTTMTPLSTTTDQPALPIEELPVADPGVDGIAVDTLLPITITELLPNPASPLTDTNDEYIELFNSNDIDVDVAGYVLQTGLTSLRKYTLPADTVIPTNGYLTLYSSQTKLSLSNSGGKAALYKPNGTDLIMQTDAYGTAQDGLVWQQSDGEWQWSSSQTPGSANILTLPIAALTKASITKTAVSKKVATTKAAAKPKAAKQPKAKAVKVKKPKATKTVKTALVAETKPKQAAIHSALLAAVLAIALLYGAYEYRHELYRQVKRLGRHRADRATDRLGPARPGTDSASK